MLAPRPLLLPLVSALTLAACDFEPPSPHTYVVSRVSVPATDAQAQAFGMDLDGDGAVDNELGRLLAQLAQQGIELQGAITGAIDQGTIILLVNLRTASFESTGDARAEVKLGDPASAVPQPCAGPSDPICRRHLDGSGAFQIAEGSPEHAALTGEIRNGTFQGGPGEVSLEISLGGPIGVPITLIGARAKATGISEARIERAVIAGALTMDRFERHVIPAIRDRIQELVRVSCPGTAPPGCGCTFGPSPSRLLLLAFDRNVDCTVSAGEVKDVALTFIAPDVDVGGAPSLSAGLEIEAVSARF